MIHSAFFRLGNTQIGWKEKIRILGFACNSKMHLRWLYFPNHYWDRLPHNSFCAIQKCLSQIGGIFPHLSSFGSNRVEHNNRVVTKCNIVMGFYFIEWRQRIGKHNIYIWNPIINTDSGNSPICKKSFLACLLETNEWLILLVACRSNSSIVPETSPPSTWIPKHCFRAPTKAPANASTRSPWTTTKWGSVFLWTPKNPSWS